MTYKLALFDTKPYDKHIFDSLKNEFSIHTTYFDTKLTKETLSLVEGFPVICLFVHDTIGSDMMNTLYMQGVRLLALRSNGYNHVDIASAKGKISIVHVPQYSPHSIAEFTIGLMLSLNRKIPLAYARTRLNNFSLVGLDGFDMVGKTVGIIGAGKIGSIVASILSAFGMNIVLFDQYENPELIAKTGCTYTSLSTLLNTSDIVTLHCPLTEETKHLINHKTLAEMKKGSFLINTGRGGLIDTTALINALKTKHIAGAALDVYEEEERFFFEDYSDSFIDDDVLARLMTFPNVILTAHQAFFTKEALTQIAQTTLQNTLNFYTKKPLLHQIA